MEAAFKRRMLPWDLPAAGCLPYIAADFRKELAHFQPWTLDVAQYGRREGTVSLASRAILGHRTGSCSESDESADGGPNLRQAGTAGVEGAHRACKTLAEGIVAASVEDHD